MWWETIWKGVTHPLTDRGSSITTLAKAVTGGSSGCSLMLRTKTITHTAVNVYLGWTSQISAQYLQQMQRAHVVNKRSAVNSVVSIVMLDVLKLMENFSWKKNTYIYISSHSMLKSCRFAFTLSEQNIKYIYNPDSLPSFNWITRFYFRTLLSRFTGFPRSHSTWEPFGFTWHLI